MEALPTFASIPANQTELPPSIGDTPEYMLVEPNDPNTPSFSNSNNEGDGSDFSKVGKMNPDDLIQLAPLDANGNPTGFDGNPVIPFTVTNAETNRNNKNAEEDSINENTNEDTTATYTPFTNKHKEEEEPEQTTLVEEEEEAHEWIEEEEDEWDEESSEGGMTTKAGDSEMSNMIAKKYGVSIDTAPPTDVDSIETELEDFIDGSMKEFENSSTPLGDVTQPPTDLDSEDSIEESVEKGNSTDSESSDEDGDESSEDADVDEDDDEESSDEEIDAEEDTNSEITGGATTPAVGDSSTPVPTDLDSIEAEMEDFIKESITNWDNVTLSESSDEDESSDDADADSSDENEESGGSENTAGGNIGKGDKGGAASGPNGKKDGIESLLDDDATKALFGDPTMAPTAKIVWNDAAPVFKPKSQDSTDAACSLSDIQACMSNPYVLGGAASIVLILLLCICRKCCCRPSRADEQGQYRQVAAKYSQMKYDDTFSDDYSADGSTGDIELSLSEVNG